MEIKQIIAENIIYLRRSHHMTQLDLANELYYSEQAISKWERGLSLPDAETLYKLSEFFNVPINYLFEKHELPEITEEEIKLLDKRDKKVKVTLIISYVIIILILASFLLSSLISIFHLESYAIFTIILPVIPIPFLIINHTLNIKGRINYILTYIIIWTSANAIYTNFLEYNLLYVFVIALILQLAIMTYPLIIKKSRNKAMEKLTKGKEHHDKDKNESSNKPRT